MVNAHCNVAVHLDKAAVCIPCETFVTCFVSKTDNSLVVKTEVEDCIHHTWHRDCCTRAN